MINPILHLTGEFSSDYTELAAGTSLVVVAVRITGNPNEIALGVVVGDGEGTPATTVHSFPVGNPSPTSPYRSVFQCLATEQFVGIDAGDGFVGEVVVYEAPAD